jgi:PTS system mannose-specific IIC component
MGTTDYLLAGIVALFAGLDRTAAFQFMISRPIVAAPMVGWLLGDPLAGLQIGAMVELLWLGRLPIGAAIPPDDTQVAVGGTVLAISMGNMLDLAGLAFSTLAVLTAMPLGKVGQLIDRAARHWNGLLLVKAEAHLAAGHLAAVERTHLRGVGHFARVSLATFVVITTAGSFFLFHFASLLIGPLSGANNWVQLAFPLIGTATILGTANVIRDMTLFGASFATALLMLWMV